MRAFLLTPVRLVPGIVSSMQADSVRWINLVCLLLGAGPVHPILAAQPEVCCYELRTYYANEGKLDQLHARLRSHALPLFAKHGISSVGYWVPLPNPDQRLVYLLAYPSREQRDSCWKKFIADPQWQTAFKNSEAAGRLVNKVESLFLHTTDYSPTIKPLSSSEPALFELRTYTAAPGKLDALNECFRDYTVRLFDKHGIEQFGYWTPMKDQKGAEDTLIYLLRHQSREDAQRAFSAFLADPEWIAAKTAAEAGNGGSLTVSNGVVSVFLHPTDYSPAR